MNYKLSDEVLAVIAQSLQLAIITGTDIVDHLRLIEVEPSFSTPDAPPASLVITAASRERIQANIDDLVKRSLELRALQDATKELGEA